MSAHVPALIVAEHLRWLREKQEEPTTPLHLVKLVYISHGWMLGFTGQPLIREAVEAWRYGPVVPEVYHAYKAFGGNPIRLPCQSFGRKLVDDQKELVEVVAGIYREFTAIQLSAMTHTSGSPWDITVKQYGLRNAIIPNPLIQKHYASLLAD